MRVEEFGRSLSLEGTGNQTRRWVVYGYEPTHRVIGLATYPSDAKIPDSSEPETTPEDPEPDDVPVDEDTEPADDVP